MLKKVKILFVALAILILTVLFVGCKQNPDDPHNHEFKNNQPCTICHASYGLKYELTDDNNSYSIASIGNCADSSVVIPKYYNNHLVTSIKEKAFYNCTSLTSITIPNSVTTIGELAFTGSGLTNIIVDDMNTDYKSIDGNLYTKDETILIQYAIGKNETTFVVPNGVASIDNNAFYGCELLTSVTIGNGVTSIGDWAFYSCKSLISVTIGNGVTSIADYAFSSCYSLVEVVNNSTHITVEKGKESNGFLGYYALSVCNSGDTFTGTKISTDNDYFIYTDDDEKVLVLYTGNETSLTLPTYINKINRHAFYGCEALTSVTISNSVTSIGDNAFYGCTNLTAVYITDIAAWCNIKFIGAVANPVYYAKKLYLNNQLLIHLIIPDNVTSIGNNAFYGCEPLTSVTIGKSVTKIGINSFNGCMNIVEVVNNSTHIKITKGQEESNGCVGRRALIVYNSGDRFTGTKVSVEGDYVVYTDDNEKTLVNYIGNKTSLTLPNNITKINANALYSCKGLTSVTIPNSVLSIGDDAFYGCTSLTSVTIGNSVRSIGDRAFCNSTSLVTITIPDNVTSIGGGAFEFCYALTNVTIGNGVKSIGSGAFYFCGSLTSVTIGSGVTSIDEFAFYNCPLLKNVYYKGTATNWAKISVDNYNSGNSYLIDATIYYYSESEPTDDGNYWHYDTDGKMPIIWQKQD